MILLAYATCACHNMQVASILISSNENSISNFATHFREIGYKIAVQLTPFAEFYLDDIPFVVDIPTFQAEINHAFTKSQNVH